MKFTKDAILEILKSSPAERKARLELIDEEGYTALTFIAAKVTPIDFGLIDGVLKAGVDGSKKDGHNKNVIETAFGKVQLLMYLAETCKIPVPQKLLTDETTSLQSRNALVRANQRGLILVDRSATIENQFSDDNISASGSSNALNYLDPNKRFASSLFSENNVNKEPRTNTSSPRSPKKS